MIAEGGLRLHQLVREWPSPGLRLYGPAPDDVLATLPDLRIADVTTAEQIYSGIFSLAGKVLHSNGQNVFELQPPSRKFHARLHEFRWLRHLSASGTELASSNARALINDWLDADSKAPFGLAWETGTAAIRLLAFLQHAPLPLAGADPVFKKRFLKSLGLHRRFLASRIHTVRDGQARMRCRVALTASRIVLPSSGAAFHDSLRKLAAETQRQVFADGGHRSRNPEILLETLLDLVPIRLAVAAEGEALPENLQILIDRMFAALAFFRHADGELALFNGTGAVIPDAINAVFRHDHTRAATPDRLPDSGFERISMRGTTLICDTGSTPDFAHSAQSHAGTLAFEMSSGRHRYIVNAGVDHLGPDAYRQISRQTVAHSTLALNETSSSRFEGSPRLVRWLGRPLVVGPEHVEVERFDDVPEQAGFRASHDGYLASTGLIHTRTVIMAPDGGRIDGTDRLLRADGSEPGEAARGQSAAIRFHLHPMIHVIRNGQGRLMLMADGDDSWELQSDGPEPELVESFFFAKVGGATRSRAITISFDPADQAVVNWRWTRTGIGTRL